MTTRRSQLTLLLALGAQPILAQSSTTAALTGEVRNAKGQPVQGAVLRLTSEALIGGSRAVVSAASGIYRAPALPPGEYRVQVEAQGYVSTTRRVRLVLGATVPMDIVLSDIASAVVEVVGSNQTLAPTSTGTSPNFSGEQLESLPLKRDLTSVMNLTPGMNSNPGATGPTAWGGDRANSNAYMIDGINVGDPLSGTQYVYVNPDWFSEIQVGGLGAPAEYGGFNGGYVNSLIKRGGNKVDGTFSAYYSPDAWRAKPRLMDPRLTFTPLPTKEWEASVNVGGPILQDKVWYFVSAQKVHSSQVPVGAPVPRDFDNPKLLGKVTWQAGQNTTLEAFLGYDGVFREHRGITNAMEPVASIKQAGADRTFGATLTQLIGQNAVLTVRGTGFHGRYQLREYQPGVAPVAFSSGSLNGLTLYRNATSSSSYMSTRGTLSAILDLTLNGVLSPRDSHTFRIGLEREQALGEQVTYKPRGLVYYATYNATTGRPRTNYVVKGGDTNLKAVLDRTVFFVQDAWTVGKWRLQPGVRVERFQGRGYGTEAIWDTSTVAPRFGLTYDAKGDQSVLLKAHYGHYFDGLTVYYFDRAVPGAFGQETRHYWGTGSSYSPVDFDINNPEAVPYNPVPYRTAADTLSSRMDPGVQHPYTQELLAAIDWQVNADWRASFTGTYRKSRRLLGRIDRNLTGGFTDRVYDPVTGNTLPVFDPTNTVQDFWIVNNPLFHRTYHLLSLSLDRRLKDRWSVSGSYTRALRRGNTNRSNGYDEASVNPSYQVNFDGKLPGYHDNELKARGLVRLPWKMDVSLAFTYLSGERFTRTIRAATAPVSKLTPSLFAEPLGTSSFPSRRLLDLKVSQSFAFGKRTRLDLFLDVFNVLNTGTPTSWVSVTSNAVSVRNATDPRANEIYSLYLKPDVQEEPRNLRAGFRLRF